MQIKRSWTRSVVTATCSVVAVLTVGAVTQPSQARPTPAAANAAAEPVGNGIAKATAVIAKVAPGVGALELATTAGVAVAETTNALAQAQSQALDLGLIGTTLTAEGCGDAALAPEDLPQPLRVDNRNGPTSASRDEVPVEGTGFGGGRLESSASDEPASSATVTGAGLAIDGVLAVGGGTAHADARVLPGAGREAHAVVESSIDIGGVALRGLRWEALHRTGVERVVEGSFAIGAAEVGGIPFPTDELAPVQGAVNEALALTGIRIELPRVVELTEPADLVRVTPLLIVFEDSPLGSTLLGPVLDASREQRAQLFDDLSAAICEAAGLLFVGDIGVSVISGTGFLAVALGGVEALSGEFVVGDAIGVPPGEAIDPPPPTPGDPGASGPIDGSSAPGTPATPGSSTGSVDQAAALQPAASIGPVEEFCESVHPFDWPTCSNGAAPLAGFMGFVATASMFGLDLRRQRSRQAPTEVAV